MPELPPILLAGLTGLISGWLLSIPVGPINLTILNEGARRGFKWAALIGLGATVMEVIYCFIAFTGFASFFTRGYINLGLELFSVGFLLFLGVKFLLAKSVQAAPVALRATAGRIEMRIEEKLHPHSGFMTGLVRVMANVGVLIFWIILAAHFMSPAREWVSPDWPGKLACVAGVGLGTGSWFLGLSWVVSLGHGKWSERTLLRIEHISGVVLVALALANGANIAWHRCGPKHKPPPPASSLPSHAPAEPQTKSSSSPFASW
jgi:threonine/homoserine/homoserine lactone efflux protein